MMNNIPVYVIVIFFILLFLGIKRCFESVLSLKRLVVLPAALIVYSQYSVYEAFHYSFYIILFIFVSAILGFFMGSSKVKHFTVLADKNQLLVKVPGTPVYLFILMGLFLSQFIVQYSIAAHMFFSKMVVYEIIAVIIVSFLSGILAGINFTFFIKYINAESVVLSKSD